MRRPVSLSTPAWAKVGMVRAARTANTKALVFMVFTPLVRRRIPLAAETMPARRVRRCDVGHAKRCACGRIGLDKSQSRSEVILVAAAPIEREQNPGAPAGFE